MRLLVHTTGEADLLLRGQGQGTLPERGRRFRRRLEYLSTLLAGDPTPQALGKILLEGHWSHHDAFESTQAPIPLLSALRAATAVGDDDVHVAVLGVHQRESDPLDTMRLAEALARALREGVATPFGCQVRGADAVRVDHHDEVAVCRALRQYLTRRAPTCQQALLTWGSGATGVQLGAVAAVVEAGMPWQFITTTDPAAVRIVDPLADLTIDPTVPTLIRWRMFEALANREVPLTTEQRDLVTRAARQHHDGLQHGALDDQLHLLADLLVRRDGTAGLAVRRYIATRYDTLLADENQGCRYPNLLEHVVKESDKRPPTLGVRIGRITEGLLNGDPAIQASSGLASLRWLLSEQAAALRLIGNGSHRLVPPGGGELRVATGHLSRQTPEDPAWARAGLPAPPVVPGDTVLAVWINGHARQDDPRPRVSQQLATALPNAIRQHLGQTDPELTALVLGTVDVDGTLPSAHTDAAFLRSRGHSARAAPISPEGGDESEIEKAMDVLVTARTGALLLVPTGPKPAVYSLMLAVRRVGARHGVALFVRQNAADGTDGYATHQWPALSGGDLPLLLAARQALDLLELDVAWRLLASSAARSEVTGAAHDLATAFAARWHQRPDRAPSGNPLDLTKRMAAQRIRLVQHVLSSSPAPADQIRLLVLAAGVLEVSIAAQRPFQNDGSAYGSFRGELKRKATARDERGAAARVLLLLNDARDKMPITHGDGATDPETIVSALAGNADDGGLPTSVDALVNGAVRAAEMHCDGDPERTGDLREAYQSLTADVDRMIDERRRGGGRR